MSLHPVYADTAALAAVVGEPTGQAERLELALVMASRWADRTVQYNIGSDAVGDEPILPIDSTPVESPIDLDVVPVDVAARAAVLVAAGRFLRSGDVPFGVAGGLGDLAVRVHADIPEAELHLVGLHRSWGVA